MPSAKLGLLRGLGGRTPSPLQARKPRCSPTSRSPMPDCALTFASLRPARPVSTSIWWQRKRSASALHLAPAESGQRKHEDACAQAKEAFARREEFQLHFLLAHPSQLVQANGASSARDRAVFFDGKLQDGGIPGPCKVTGKRLKQHAVPPAQTAYGTAWDNASRCTHQGALSGTTRASRLRGRSGVQQHCSKSLDSAEGRSDAVQGLPGAGASQLLSLTV